MASAVFDLSKFELIKVQIMQSFQNFSKLLGLTINSKKTINFFMDVIKNSVRYREENNVKRNDFLQLLIQLKDSDAGMTMNEMAANSCKKNYL
jgi:cytochrome P450 family 6